MDLHRSVVESSRDYTKPDRKTLILLALSPPTKGLRTLRP